MIDQKGPIKFGDYYLIDRIAVGGMAEIWRAKTVGLEGFERVVSIKCILPAYTQNPEFNSMFIDEARIASTLNHSNIVRITNFGVIDNKYYHEMEFVDGRNLRQIMQKCKEEHVPFPIDSACYLISEVSKGLHYAHTKYDSINNEPLNIVHRDISPQNIMLSFEGEIKIIDWGIAKAKGKIEETRAGVLKGKFGYMSPEQAEGEELDLRSDIFSLGIVFYEAITGERLFLADNEINTLKKIKQGNIPLPSRVNPEIDKELDTIVMKSLARARIERYQTCYDLYEDLVKYLHKKYPAYNSLKLSRFVKELFSSEIVEDRKRVFEREQSVPSYSASSYSQSNIVKKLTEDRTRVSSSTDGGAVGYAEEGERTLMADSQSGVAPDATSTSDLDRTEPSFEQYPEPHVEDIKVDVNKLPSQSTIQDYKTQVKESAIPSLAFGNKQKSKKRLYLLSGIFLLLLLVMYMGMGSSPSPEDKSIDSKEQAGKGSNEQLAPTEDSKIQSEAKEIADMEKDDDPSVGSAQAEVPQVPIDGQYAEPVEETRPEQMAEQMPEQMAEQMAEQIQEQVPQELEQQQLQELPQPLDTAKTGSIFLSSKPTGAQIIIDDTARGKTPATVSGLLIGKRYIIKLSAEGFEPETKAITLRSEKNDLMVELLPLKMEGDSYLSINVAPPMLIYIDGKLVSNYRSLSMHKVEPGERLVRFVNQKLGIDHSMKLMVERGANIQKDITLR